MATQQLGFYVNQQFCMGCKTCQVACKDQHNLDVGINLRRVIEVAGGGFTQQGATVQPHVFAYWLSIACNHCTDPKCTANCPTGACRKNPTDGVVAIDQQVCIGCQYCTWSCPYGGPQYDPSSGTTKKCDLCADRRAQGQNPACVEACPMRAIEWGPIDELKQKHPDAVPYVAGLPSPELTHPNVLYTPHPSALAHPVAPVAAAAKTRR